MGLLSWLGISKPRDAPTEALPDIQDNVRDSANLFVFGMTHSGERVDERTAMLPFMPAFACYPILSPDFPCTFTDTQVKAKTKNWQPIIRCTRSSTGSRIRR